MTVHKRKLVGNRDLFWVVLCVAICVVFVGTLLHHLSLRHEVYRLGYEVAAQTEEHNRLLEENRRLMVEAAFQSNAERLEAEAFERLGLRATESDQVVPVRPTPRSRGASGRRRSRQGPPEPRGSGPR